MKGILIRENAEKKLINPTVLFLYISIIILTVLTIFLGYKLLSSLDVFNSSGEGNELVQKNRIIQLEILNGCGIAGIADKFTDELRKKNFDVVHTGNYRSFNIDESIVISRTHDTENAKLVAKALGIDETKIIMQANKDYFLDATLIIGKDYKQLLTKNIR